MRRYNWMLPVGFIAAVLVISFSAFWVMSTITQSQVGGVDLNSQDLKVRLDELRWSLQMLILAAGLFAVAQGAAAFFNAQSFSKQAEDAIKRVQEQAREAEARYPVFARTETVRHEAYASLADIFADPFFLDWRESAYVRLGIERRQKLLSVERFIGIELVRHPGGPAEYVRDLRRLANFYASKHSYEAARGGAQWVDLERSEYYLLLALREAGEESYQLLTDLGVLYMEYYKPRRLAEAIKKFEDSARKKREQQRAPYNLGVAAGYENRWADALRHYEDARRYLNWEVRPLDEMRCMVHYNHACACARRSYEDTANVDYWVAECLTSIQATARLGFMSDPVLTDDLTTKDFSLLDAKTKAEIETLREKITKPQTPSVPAPKGLKDRMRSTLEIWWKRD